ncbi:hypothetical protein G6O67_003558 [Ophiocordyceps sinensis]|uniref:Regulator of G protein signaling superfamily n=1 Tax=Ophiocordyceps sinensis TaxID=72228 RepID=A0A8H4PS00_9HYPO|nr:hypothetical protein G6O67_003558 [Ophiocordyceps sinensis]
MASMAGLTIYNFPPGPPRWDRIGIFYIVFACTWTALVLLGMAFCWHHRRLPILKLRGLPLSFSAILCLHSYWILAMMTYPIGGTMPVVLAYDVQYFVMGIYFPLGIALFHASSCRFLHVAKMQKQFTHPEARRRAACKGVETWWLCRLANMYYSTRLMTFIAVGMVFQLAKIALTVAMWLACRKYHPTYGIPGTEIRGASLPEQLVDLGRGWEWWPSVVWQVIWTWIVAPILIWRAWGIHDTMGWRTQTIGCCLSNLHATPMFLIASYVPAFEVVNAYFTPSQWIHLSTMMFEIFTVFIPVFQVLRLRCLNRRAADMNAKWETESQASTLRPSTSCEISSLSLAEKGGTLDHLDEELGDRLLTMSALEYVLGGNPGPLQEFSALSDFSGENIAFLTLVASWKTSWPASSTDESRLEAYRRALAIYTGFISPRDAEFPLNLSSGDVRYLEHMFEEPARMLHGEARVDPVTPFATEAPFCGHRPGMEASTDQYAGEVPGDFDAAVFDRAQGHIKYLVLTNTWPKFVDEMQQRRRSCETGRSILTASSQETLASRFSKRMADVCHYLMN